MSRWQDLFGVSYDVLLYDLTSTYSESDPPFGEGSKHQYGYSRDHRPDCVQVVIAVVVTAEGFPLAYEVMAGNTADNTTLPGFLAARGRSKESRRDDGRCPGVIPQGLRIAIPKGARWDSSLTP